MVQVPKVVIHEPVWWDQWTEVHHPGTSCGEMLDVPPVNWRGKLDVEDLARFYPKEWFAEQVARRLRQLERIEMNRIRAIIRRNRYPRLTVAKDRSPTATPPGIVSHPYSIYFL